MTDDDILKEARERLAQCIKHDSESRRESIEDFRFVAGEQWPADMRQLRQVEARPCLTINKLPAFVHQVVNDQRQNRPSIKVHPVDDNADPEIAEVIQGLIRHIEYGSSADAAYDTAVGHATIGGFGYFRLVTDYTSEDSFDQEIRFRRVQNPFSVYLDPFSTEPDGSDMRFAFVTELIDRAQFKADYPDAEVLGAENLITGAGDAVAVWVSDDSIRVAEYYRVVTTAAALCRLNTGQTIWKDELPNPLPDGITIDAERQSEKRTVEWFKVTAADILERTEIPCRWIPLFPVYGDEHIVDGRVRKVGMVRFARDPQRMYNFWMTSATEEVSLRPKTPYIGALGQFDTSKKDWRQANNRSFAFLEYDPIDVNGQQAPPPQRQPMADVPAGVLAMAMHASDNIKATTGIFDASLGAQGNETSGRAITARQREGDTSNFHFADNLGRTMRQCGRCLVEMIQRVYDTARVVRILGEDDKMDTAQINTPIQPQQTQSGAIKTVMNDLSVGKYDVTIGTGPAYSTKRAEFVDAAMQLGQSVPQLWQAAGDLIVRAMDWPKADEIADRIAATIPAQIKGESGDQQQIPPQVQQVLQQAQGEIQQLQQALQESKSGMDKAKLDAAVKLQTAQMGLESSERIAASNNDTRRDVAELSGLVQLLLQKMTPPPVLAADVAEDIASDDQPPQPVNGQAAAPYTPPIATLAG